MLTLRELFLLLMGKTSLLRNKRGKKFSPINEEIMLADPEPFSVMLKMSPCKLEERFNLVTLDLIKPNAHRDSIEPGKSLVVFVRYLATGDAFTIIAQSYRISNPSVYDVL